MKQRFIREGDELKDNSSIVVRGGPLDPEVITPDALRHHDIYGTYGISVFAIRDTTLDELAQQPPLIRFELLTGDSGRGSSRSRPSTSANGP